MRTRTLTSDVEADLRDLIATEYGPGDKLPAEKELAVRLGVSRNTLREALLGLWNDGLVTRRWGVGTFVRESSEPLAQSLTRVQPLRQMLKGTGHELSMRAVEIETVACPALAAVALSVPEGTDIWHISRTWAIDGRPAFVFQNWIMKTVNGHTLDPSVLKDAAIDLLEWLLKSAHCRVVRMEAELQAVGAEGSVAAQLDVPVGTHLIAANQVAFSDPGDIVIYSRNYYQTGVLSLRLVRTPQF
jgi:GntR family transcriptional regulator